MPSVTGTSPSLGQMAQPEEDLNYIFESFVQEVCRSLMHCQDFNSVTLAGSAILKARLLMEDRYVQRG